MRIAIIGCGYVGSALGEALVEGGHDVVGTTTTPERAEELKDVRIRPEVVEVADVVRMHEVLSDREVVYLTIAPRARRQDYREVYLAGVTSLLAAAKETPIRRLIYTSSTRVYGQDDGGWVDESSPAVPKDENGRILLDAERTLLTGADALGGDRPVQTTVVRLSGIYGPGRDPARRIVAAAGTERTDGDAYVNLIHLDDIVSALVRLLDVSYHGVLNLSDDKPTRRSDFYDRVMDEAGLPPIRWHRTDLSPGKGKRISNALIKATLGLVLTHPTH